MDKIAIEIARLNKTITEILHSHPERNETQ
jgi:hypothetical protein